MNFNLLHHHARTIRAAALNNRGTIKGFLNLSSVRGTQMLLGLVTTYFLARALTVEQYGEYQFVLTIIGLLTIFTLTEFKNTVMQSVARGYTGSYRKILIYPFLGSLAGSLILLLLAFWQGFHIGHKDLMACFFIASAAFPFMHGLTLWKAFRIGEKNFAGLAKMEIATGILTTAAIVSITQFYGGQYIGVILAFMGFPALANLFMLYRLRGLLRDETPAEEGIIEHGGKSSLYSAVSVASNYADKLLLFFFLSPTALALFAVGDRLSGLLKTSAADISSALAPKFAETRSYTRKLDRIMKIFCILFGCLMVAFAFTLLPWAIRLLYGPAFAEAIPYAQALVCSAAIGNLATLQFRYIRSKLDTENFRKITVYTSLFRVLISAILIPLMGLTGAVISAFAYRISLSFYTNRLIHKTYGATHELP